MDCEQLEYILDIVSSEEYIKVDFYAYNGMPLGCIDSTTRVWSTEKGLLIIDNGQYTYFINIADLSHIIIKNKNEEVYESINKVEEEILSGKNWIVFDWSSVNEERKKQNLPKISNQAMKDAYIAELLEDLTEEYNQMKMEYQYLHEIWKFKLRNNI